MIGIASGASRRIVRTLAKSRIISKPVKIPIHRLTISVKRGENQKISPEYRPASSTAIRHKVVEMRICASAAAKGRQHCSDC